MWDMGLGSKGNEHDKVELGFTKNEQDKNVEF